jgi:hypothetical protein
MYSDRYLYVFFDASTESFETCRESDFSPMFPWYWYGALFSTRNAAFTTALSSLLTWRNAFRQRTGMIDSSTWAETIPLHTDSSNQSDNVVHTAVLHPVCVPRVWVRWNKVTGQRMQLEFDLWRIISARRNDCKVLRGRSKLFSDNAQRWLGCF